MEIHTAISQERNQATPSPSSFSTLGHAETAGDRERREYAMIEQDREKKIEKGKTMRDTVMF